MSDVRNYIAVTGAYWGFTLSDGALRMLVLLHFHKLGYTPLDLAFLFLLYEAMGVLTNFFGGWLATRFGLRLTLFSGLALQIAALIMLSFMVDTWSTALSLSYVMAAQAISGIAKDLTKMSAKSAVKLVVGEGEHAVGNLLFKWVALLTGSKNALKGIGFLLGGVMLQWMGFTLALWLMAGVLGVVLLFALAGVRGELGKAKGAITRRDLFSKSREINLLSLARVFLFAARDVWFVVGVPVFLYTNLGWRFDQVGTFMAVWIVGYGIVQAVAPRLLGATHDANAAATQAKIWGGVLALVTALIAWAMTRSDVAGLSPDVVLIGGLMIFGAVFAMNSSVHSYLIVAYSDTDKVSLNVGFYYMANAVGRFVGTLLSGLVFQYAGLSACLIASAAMIVIATAVTLLLPGKGHMRKQAT